VAIVAIVCAAVACLLVILVAAYVLTKKGKRAGADITQPSGAHAYAIHSQPAPLNPVQAWPDEQKLSPSPRVAETSFSASPNKLGAGPAVPPPDYLDEPRYMTPDPASQASMDSFSLDDDVDLSQQAREVRAEAHEAIGRALETLSVPSTPLPNTVA